MSTRQAGRCRVRYGTARRGADGSAGTVLVLLTALVGSGFVTAAWLIAHLALPGALR